MRKHEKLPAEKQEEEKGIYRSQQSRIQSHASLVNVIEFNIKKL